MVVTSLAFIQYCIDTGITARKMEIVVKLVLVSCLICLTHATEKQMQLLIV